MVAVRGSLLLGLLGLLGGRCGEGWIVIAAVECLAEGSDGLVWRRNRTWA